MKYQDTTTTERDNALDEREIRFLMRHYPWFTRNEIEEAAVAMGHNRSKVMAYLHMKSGGWNSDELYES